jgi:hypothetical protein
MLSAGVAVTLPGDGRADGVGGAGVRSATGSVAAGGGCVGGGAVAGVGREDTALAAVAVDRRAVVVQMARATMSPPATAAAASAATGRRPADGEIAARSASVATVWRDASCAFPQRHVVTFAGTRRPQAGHTQLNPSAIGLLIGPGEPSHAGV